MLNQYKIAIVCDWLTTMGGAERVIAGLHQLFPNAPIYTSLYNSKTIRGFENAYIITSKLQYIPGAKRHHQWVFPFMPSAFERFDMSSYDIVISSSHSCAKGIITKPNTLHVSYCHTPMRYAWDNSIRYIKEYHANKIAKIAAPFFIHKLRMWDRLSAERVDEFIANSHHVQKRIQKFYRRPSSIIYPFIEAKNFRYDRPREDFYLAVGRLTSYKKFDLLIEAFNELGLPLKIVGTGGSYPLLKKMAHKNIEFLGYVDDAMRNELYQKAKALLFPQEEDFGITPLEAMASGCPIIAYGKGGALETIVDGSTGIFFKEQLKDSLVAAVRKCEDKKWNASIIRLQAEKFDKGIFHQKILQFLEEKYADHCKNF